MQGVANEVLPQFRSKLQFFEAFKRDQLMSADFVRKTIVALVCYACTSFFTTQYLVRWLNKLPNPDDWR